MIATLEDIFAAVGITDEDHVSISHYLRGADSPKCVVAPSREALGLVQRSKFDGDVFFGASPVSSSLVGTGRRGGEDDVTRVVALYADLDFKPTGCRDARTAWQIINDVSVILGQRPVVVIFSGHGLQPIWALGDCSPDKGMPLIRRFGRLVKRVARDRNAAVDNVFEIARVLRVPGTFNCKNGERVKVTAERDKGAPLTVGEVHERLTEHGIHELPEDAGLGDEVIRHPDECEWAAQTCNYMNKAVSGWSTDNPPARHPWLLSQFIRLECARRQGCLTQDDYDNAVGVLTQRFEELCARPGDTRSVKRFEIRDIRDEAISRASRKTDEQTAAELKNHDHPLDLGGYLTGMANPFAGSVSNGEPTEDRTVGPSPDRVRESELAGLPGVNESDASPLSSEAGSDQGDSIGLSDSTLGCSPIVRLQRPYVDIVALLDGTLPAPPKPAVLKRRDGHCLFYAGQVNWLFGDPEAGKTFIALAASVEQLILNGSVLVIDMDHNTAEATVGRLLMMGAPKGALRDPNRFRYVDPESRTDLVQVLNDAILWKPSVVVVDSIGELLPMFRASSNSPDEFTVVHAALLKPLARTGACVIAIDHLAKNAESRAQGPSGTAAKRRAVGGISLRVKAVEQFTPGKGGKALLLIHKDRHGGLRAVCERAEHRSEPVAGTFILHPEDAYLYPGELRWYVATPGKGERDPDSQPDPELVALIEAMEPKPTSAEEARKMLRCSKERANKAFAEWKAKQDNGTQEESTR